MSPLRLFVSLTIFFALTPAIGVSAPVTFAKDIAPIMFEHCAMCHRPGEVAPMSLLSYEEARPWAKSIAKVVRDKTMPPWSGESAKHQWRNDISLSDEQIATMLAWVEQGSPLGDKNDLPPAPKFTDGWKLGEPDHIVTLKTVNVAEGGDDLFLKEVIEIDLGEPKWIRAIEFMPGDRRVTHHIQATYRNIAPDGSAKAAGGAENLGVGGILAIWTAGMPPFEFPDGVGRPIGPKARILIDSHYHPVGIATSDTTKIGLYFGKGPLQKEVATLVVANTGIRIPPEAPAHPEVGFLTFDYDAKILAFSPHLHVRGKAMRYDLILPNGERETLLDVPKYNYNWQWQYYPTEPIDAPAGSKLEVTAVWDNSPANPANPDPKKEIIYRGDTFNEMFVGFVEAIPAEGVQHKPISSSEKLKKLLAEHPPEDCYWTGGFFPFAMYLPKQGKGWMYLAQGINMFAITLDDIQWDGDKVKVVTQLPTPEASATTSIYEGVRDAQGRMKGALQYGVDSPQPMKLTPILKPVTESGN
jgi:hypothetical protein